MSLEPSAPDLRHVYVRGQGGIGAPEPGIVIDWARQPVHNANASSWLALVATCPNDSTLVVSWVSAERLIAIRDPSPAGVG